MIRTSKLKLHKAVELLPEMLPPEYIMLRTDIQIFGIKEPLLVLGNEVIDGRHRLRAAKELGIKEIPTTEANITEDEIEDLVISLNLKRRHLSPGQKALIALEIYESRDNGVPGNPKGRIADRVAEEAGVGPSTVKRVQYIRKNGTKDDIRTLRSGSETAKPIMARIRAKLKPQPTPAAKTDSTSSNNITTNGIKVVGDIPSINNIVDSTKIDYVLKHGNDIQRMAVKNKPEAATAIYNTITTKDQTSIPPTPMPTVVPPVDTYKAKYDDLWIKYEKLLSICTDLEAQLMEVKGEVVQKDYTQLKGENITVEELDKVGLAFTDHPTYVRLMKEHEAHRMAEYKKGFTD